MEWLINHWPWYNPPAAPIEFKKQVDAFREGGKVLIRSGPFKGHCSTVLEIMDGKHVGDAARAKLIVEFMCTEQEVIMDVGTLLPQD